MADTSVQVDSASINLTRRGLFGGAGKVAAAAALATLPTVASALTAAQHDRAKWDAIVLAIAEAERVYNAFNCGTVRPAYVELKKGRYDSDAYSKLEDDFGELVDIHHHLLLDMLELSPPDIAGLIYKLQTLCDRDYLCSEHEDGDGAGPLKSVVADVRRLAVAA